MSRVLFTAVLPVPIAFEMNGTSPSWSKVPPLELKLALLAFIERSGNAEFEQLRFEAQQVTKSAVADTTEAA
jgi:hypothetical protein